MKNFYGKRYIYALILFMCCFLLFRNLYLNRNRSRYNADVEGPISKVNETIDHESKSPSSKNATASVDLENSSSSLLLSTTTKQPTAVCGYFVRSPLDYGTRLGNHLFMYASFYGMAKKQNMFAHKTAFIRVSNHPSVLEKIFDHLSIPQKIVSDSWMRSSNFQNQYERKMCAYDDVGFFQLACDGQNVSVGGYRQSHRYFDIYFEEIKQEFTFKKSIQEQCNRFFNESLAAKNLSRAECTTVGVHLRRGDFVNKGNYRPASIDYLNKAVRYHEIAHFENNTLNIDCLVFVIFGDTPEWNVNAINQVQFLRPNSTFFVLIDSKKSTPEIDLCMMRHCDHMIMSTGSFGWWGAFFSQGVVTYQKEFARVGSSLYFEYEPKDFYLPHWIPL